MIKGEKGDNGLSAYEIYKKYHPEYQGSDYDWINDLVNGELSISWLLVDNVSIIL